MRVTFPVKVTEENTMAGILKKIFCVVVAPHKIFLRIDSLDQDKVIDSSERYHIDRMGNISMNPLNKDNQTAFEKNVVALSKSEV